MRRPSIPPRKSSKHTTAPVVPLVPVVPIETADEAADDTVNLDEVREAFTEAELADVTDVADQSDTAPEVIDDELSETTEDSEAEASEPPVTARDVWRATRARRKAQRAEARRFTKRLRRRRLVRTGLVAGSLLAVGGVVAIAYSPLFAVQQVVVSGADDELATDITAALAPNIGTPLASVDLDQVRTTVEAFPLVETYQVEARPPHELLVRVVQRTPIGAVRQGDGFALVDAAGVVLSTSTDQPQGYALIDIDPQHSPEAFQSAGTCVRALPEGIRSQIAEVRGSTGDDTVVRLQSGTTITWGSGDESALKTVVLERLMAANPEAWSFDVSAPEVPVVR